MVDEKNVRESKVMILLNEEEKKMLEALCKLRGMSYSAYLRNLIYEKYRTEVI